MAIADLLLINGRVLTMEEQNPVAEAVAIGGDKILAIGRNQEILAMASNTARLIDLQGKTVLPGFFDSHTHFLQTGLDEMGVSLLNCRTVADILDLIAQAAQQVSPGEIICGINYDDSKLAERRPPTRQELDRVAPNHSVWLNRIDSHSCTVNSKFLSLVNLPADTVGIDRDHAGQPTGVLRADASLQARKKLFDGISDEQRARALGIAADLAAQAGITTVCALEGGELLGDRGAEYLLNHQNDVKIRIELFMQIMDVARVQKLGLPRIGGCILLDGSMGSYTAAVSEPYADRPETNGLLYFTQDEINDFILAAHQAGLQATCHAIGDRATEQLLTAYELALQKEPRKDHRHRIEHAEILTNDQIKRIAQAGIILSMQPTFEYYWGGVDNMYGTRLGPERVKITNRYRDIIDAGILICGGSDSDVTPMNPILGIHAAVNHPNPAQRVTPLEAVKMFTINGAIANFAEKTRGSIRAGKLADLVILSDNPLEVPPQKIKEIEVVQTIVGGKGVFGKIM